MATVSVFILAILLINLSLIAQLDQNSSEIPYGKIIKEIKIEVLKRTQEHIVSRELLSKVGKPLLKENLEKEYSRLELKARESFCTSVHTKKPVMSRKRVR